MPCHAALSLVFNRYAPNTANNRFNRRDAYDELEKSRFALVPTLRSGTAGGTVPRVLPPLAEFDAPRSRAPFAGVSAPACA